jgi:hypothetical protein
MLSEPLNADVGRDHVEISHCVNCGLEMVRAWDTGKGSAAGRPARFCNALCRVEFWRARQKAESA